MSLGESYLKGSDPEITPTVIAIGPSMIAVTWSGLGRSLDKD